MRRRYRSLARTKGSLETACRIVSSEPPLSTGLVPSLFVLLTETLEPMEFSQDDFDRLLMFEHTRKSAEATYAKDPLDADVSIFFLYLPYSLSEPLSDTHACSLFAV